MRTLTFLLFLFFFNINAQNQPWQGKFEPIDNMIAPPNSYRNASGAPTKAYWQQRADYKIKAVLNEKTNTLFGEEVITYFNNSPDDLSYLWIQLEQNVNKKENEDFRILSRTKLARSLKQKNDSPRSGTHRVVLKKYLKKLGYKTFDKWWDESYDNELDLDIRLNMIIQILKDLSEKTEKELLFKSSKK